MLLSICAYLTYSYSSLSFSFFVLVFVAVLLSWLCVSCCMRCASWPERLAVLWLCGRADSKITTASWTRLQSLGKNWWTASVGPAQQPNCLTTFWEASGTSLPLLLLFLHLFNSPFFSLLLFFSFWYSTSFSGRLYTCFFFIVLHIIFLFPSSSSFFSSAVSSFCSWCVCASVPTNHNYKLQSNTFMASIKSHFKWNWDQAS